MGSSMSREDWLKNRWYLDWVSKKYLEDTIKTLNRYTHAREKISQSPDTFTTNSCDQKTEVNKNKDLAK